MEGSSSFKVKKEALEFSGYLSNTFSENGRTNLGAICADEGLPIIVDNYRGYFDGMLVWDGKCFNIHLDSSKGNTPASRRGRFTLAHVHIPD